MTHTSPAPPSFLPRLADAVLAALAVTAKVIIAHTLLTGIAVVLIAYFAASSTGTIRSITAALATLALHAAATPFVVFWATLIATAAAVQRLGIARMILAAAARRAESLHPELRERTDFAAASRALAEAFESLAHDDLTPAVPGTRPSAARRLAPSLMRRVVRRVVRIVGRVTLKQLNLAPAPDGAAPFATIDEWLGAQIDAFAATAIRTPAIRWIIIILASQLLATIAVIAAARTLPPLW